MENLYTARIIRPSAFSHLTDNAFCLHAPPPHPSPPPPIAPPTHKKLHNLGFSFLLGITIASKEIEDNTCAGFFFREVGQKGVFWEMCKWQMDKRQNMDFKLIIKDDYLKLK